MIANKGVSSFVMGKEKSQLAKGGGGMYTYDVPKGVPVKRPPPLHHKLFFVQVCKSKSVLPPPSRH